MQHMNLRKLLKKHIQPYFITFVLFFKEMQRKQETSQKLPLLSIQKQIVEPIISLLVSTTFKTCVIMFRNI